MNMKHERGAIERHMIHGKVRVTIWRVGEGWVTIWRVRVRVMWVTIWYLTMNYLPRELSPKPWKRKLGSLDKCD